jgi:hypothetical protein
LNTSGRLLHHHLDDDDDDDDNNNNNNNNNNQDDLGLRGLTTTYPMSLEEEKEAIDREEWCLNLNFPHHKR